MANKIKNWRQAIQSDRSIEDTIVITSAIYPPSDIFALAITDPNIRLLQTYCSLLLWIQDTAVSRIVICDNTVPPFIFDPILPLAKSSGVAFEVLYYKQNNKLVQIYGKGYGEGNILSHIVLNSRLIQETPNFYKITGRHFIKNFDKVHALDKDKTTIFKNLPYSRVDTRFFKCNLDTYKTTLISCYKKVRDRDGIYIEHLFREKLKNINYVESFSEDPIIVGFSGSMGKMYDIDYESNIIDAAKRLLYNNSTFTYKLKLFLLFKHLTKKL